MKFGIAFLSLYSRSRPLCRQCCKPVPATCCCSVCHRRRRSRSAGRSVKQQPARSVVRRKNIDVADACWGDRAWDEPFKALYRQVLAAEPRTEGMMQTHMCVAHYQCNHAVAVANTSKKRGQCVELALASRVGLEQSDVEDLVQRRLPTAWEWAANLATHAQVSGSGNSCARLRNAPSSSTVERCRQ